MQTYSKALDKIITFFRQNILFKNLPEKFENVLDIGCGPRPWFLYLEKKKFEPVKFFALDKQAYKFGSPNVSSIQSDISQTLPFKDGSFDLVTMLAVLEHLEHPKEIIEELYRVLKPGGTLILTTPSPMSKPILEFLAFKLKMIDHDGIAEHKHYFSEKELENLLESKGFIVNKLHAFELGVNIFAKATKVI